MASCYVPCTTRKFYLRLRPAIKGVRRLIFRSTGTKEIAAAKPIGAQVIESFGPIAERAEALKLRNDNTTIGELIERY